MFAYQQLLFWLNWLLLAAVCVGAWRWGGRAERSCAMLVLAAFTIVVLVNLVHGGKFVQGLYLALDGLLALGLLLLALRHATRWLGVAVLLQAVQFSLHAYYIVVGRRYDGLYVLVNNLVTMGVLICVLAGVILAKCKRRAFGK
ncbi:hypothetical protein K8940_03310 [Caulobacter segnis]|jgi:hypothetical protein|nr:hypothetical protein K8940_03310 [Caulobacter segnis]